VLLPLVAVAALLVEFAGDGVDASWWVLAVLGTGLVAAVAVLMVRVTVQVAGYVTEIERSRAEFRRALGHLGEALASTDDRAALAGVMLDATRAMAGASVAVFYADAGHHLVAVAHRGAPNIEGRRVERGRGLAGSVAERGEPARWPPASAPPAPPEPEVGSAMAVPLFARNRLYGVLALYGNERNETFRADELDDVIDFARQAEVAIDSSYLHEEARRLSVTDGLTGVWNRRHFDLRCSQELDRARRFGEHFAILMCDIDGFKGVNDTYGHQVGDAVLVEMAQRLVDEAREVDLVARYGGEEFVLVLSRTEITGAVVVAERIRAAVEREPFRTDVGLLPVTVSVGVACHPTHGDTIGSLLGAADAALYEAKQTGRNRVCYAAEATSPDGAPAS
jgi:two-component system, cell cycle response regulator